MSLTQITTTPCGHKDACSLGSPQNKQEGPGKGFVFLAERNTMRMFFFFPVGRLWGFLGDSDGKESACNVGDLGSISGLGRSTGKGNGSPLHYSCLENPMDRRAWRAAVHGVTKSQTRLSDSHTHTEEGYSFCIFHCLGSTVDVFHLVDLSCVPFQFTTFSESPSRVKFQPYLAPQIKDTCAPTTDIDSLGSHVKCANTVSSHYNR